MEPELQKLVQEFDGKAKIVKIDFDASQDLAEKYSVQGLPTFVVLKDGQETGRVVGPDVAQVKSLVNQAM